MAQLALFPDMVEIARPKEPEPEPAPVQVNSRTKRRMIGDNFVVVKCLNCSQMIMVDPQYYELDEYRDKICEACNDKYWNKYAKYLKLKL